MNCRKTWWAACLALALLLSTGSLGAAKPSASPSIPLPSAGNVTVARFLLQTSSQSGAPAPKLTLASRLLPADAFVVATVGRDSRPTRYVATVAIVRPSVESPQAGASAGRITLRLPPGFTLAGAPTVVRDVVYANPVPSFRLAAGGIDQLLGGTSPSKLPLSQIVTDAQLLALDRSVPLADMALLGLPYVAAQFSRAGTTLRVSIVISRMSQVNGVELRFPSGVTVARVTGPSGTEGSPTGSAVRLIALGGFFQEGRAYSFVLQLKRAPKTGDFVTLRASTHYFESSLPFTERFALP